MGTLSFHSNGNKNANFVDANAINISAKFQLDPFIASQEMIFEHFFSQI